MENIQGILVSLIAPFDNHIANGGDKMLGNASSIKRRPDGRVYVAGQMQRHVFFSALRKLNNIDPSKANTFVSNADGISENLHDDLRADLGGFMHTEKGELSTRRTGALSVTVAVAKDESKVKNDLLNRMNSGSGENPAIATKEFSQHDDMVMNFYLDMNTLSLTENFIYEDGFNVDVEYNDHGITIEERKRRALLFLKATAMMNDYANQSRNAVCGEPRQVVIVFDTIASRKAMRYLTASEQEQINIADELNSRGAKMFVGDDTTSQSVNKAYLEAIKLLNASKLYDPVKNRKEKESD
ncbi:MAG: type I-PGING CRISPR-associated protein Cas7/Csp1 [Paludibacteraceae bacterium]|nr:type I-PGING CRISPR-associated protein Cas7/Csp1 [Paludibacteraceae bacterium]